MSLTITTIDANPDSKAPSIYVKNLEDFMAILNENDKVVFKKDRYNSSRRNQSDQDAFFFIPRDGVIFRCNCNRFLSIQDYIDSKKIGINTQEGYNKYKFSGAESKSQFLELSKDQFCSVKEHREYGELGLDSIFLSLDELLQNEQVDPSLKSHILDRKSKASFLRYYKSSGSESLSDFKQFIVSGFSNFKDWNVAHSKGFLTREDYDLATKRNFNSFQDYQDAEEVGIRLNSQFQKFKLDLIDAVKKGYDTFEFFLLSESFTPEKFPNRLHRIFSFIESRAKSLYGSEYKFTDEFNKIKNYSYLFEKLKSNFSIKSDIIDGITSNQVHNYKAVVDANNVCWYEKNELNSTAKSLRASQLIEMEEILIAYGASEVFFVADANLPYQVDSREVLQNLEYKGSLIYSNNEKADNLMLSLALKEDSVVVSNDKFSEYDVMKLDKIKLLHYQKDTVLGFDLI